MLPTDGREGEQKRQAGRDGLFDVADGARDGTEEPEVGLDGKEVGLEDLSSVI